MKDDEVLTVGELALFADMTTTEIENFTTSESIPFETRSPSFWPETIPLYPIEALDRILTVKTRRQTTTQSASLSKATDRTKSDSSQATEASTNEYAQNVIVTAIAYVKARNASIHSDPKVMGGTPVIKGTRILTEIIAIRLAEEGAAELASDYPDIPRSVFETAATFDRAHPLPKPCPPANWRLIHSTRRKR